LTNRRSYAQFPVRFILWVVILYKFIRRIEL
jgi:hypothetical protein